MQLGSITQGLIGGGLIGISVTLMLLFNGRVTGISGILGAALSRNTHDGIWRWLFILGLIAGGTVVGFLRPDLFQNTSDRDLGTVALAGLLVGYGTSLGSGCTSGHGICGISRLSIRSFLATATFMVFGFIAVLIVRVLSGAGL